MQHGHQLQYACSNSFHPRIKFLICDVDIAAIDAKAAVHWAPLLFVRTGQSESASGIRRFCGLRSASSQTTRALCRWLLWQVASLAFRQNWRVPLADWPIRPVSSDKCKCARTSHRTITGSNVVKSVKQLFLICLLFFFFSSEFKTFGRRPFEKMSTLLAHLGPPDQQKNHFSHA